MSVGTTRGAWAPTSPATQHIRLVSGGHVRSGHEAFLPLPHPSVNRLGGEPGLPPTWQ